MDLVALDRRRPDWSVLMGPEDLLGPSVLAGGNGGVPGGANLFPRLFVSLYRAAWDGDIRRARDLQARVSRVGERLYGFGRHPSTTITGIKCAAELLGLGGDFMAEPFHRFREPERRVIQKALEELRSIVDA